MDRRRFLAALGGAPFLAHAGVYAEGSLPLTADSQTDGCYSPSKPHPQHLAER